MNPLLQASALQLLAILPQEASPPPTFSRAALERAAAYLDRLCGAAEEPPRGWLALRAGALLGECLLAEHGGTWIEEGDDWVLRLPNGCILLPFDSAREHLERGSGSSILRYYDAVGSVLRADKEWDLTYL